MCYLRMSGFLKTYCCCCFYSFPDENIDVPVEQKDNKYLPEQLNNRLQILGGSPIVKIYSDIFENSQE